MLDIMGGCPFDYDKPELWHMTLFVSDTEINEAEVKQDAVYEATPLSANLWHDPDTDRTNLVIPFKSADAAVRFSELRATNQSAYKDTFYPHMTLVHGFPQLAQSYKTFILSITMSLRSEGVPFKFVGEALVDSHGRVPNREGMEFFAERDID